MFWKVFWHDNTGDDNQQDENETKRDQEISKTGRQREKNKIRIEEDEEGEAREAEHIILHNRNQYRVNQLKRELCGMNNIVLFKKYCIV